MFKSHYLLLLVFAFLCSCQKTEKQDLISENQLEIRSQSEATIYDFNRAEMYYYPEFEGGALFLGNDQDEFVQIIKLDGFFTGEATFSNGTVTVAEKYVAIHSENHPTTYLVFNSFLEEFNKTINPNSSARVISGGVGIGQRGAFEGQEDFSYSNIVNLRNKDGGDVYGDKVPCNGFNAIHKYCPSGGCGASSCGIGGGMGGGTINANCQCRISCESGYYACCKECEGCSCFKEECCDAKF